MIYFTSDLHLGHGNIIIYSQRPFLNSFEQEEVKAVGRCKVSKESIDKMDSHLIGQINKIVGTEDILYHLGDFCMGKYESAVRYIDRINCKNLVMIRGNHDHESILKLPRGDDQPDLLELNAYGQHIVLCHYAMAIWNRSHHGSWHLYGHSHSMAESKLNSVYPTRRSMDVGVDNIVRLLGEYRPISFNEVRKLIGHKAGAPIPQEEKWVKE